MRIVYFKTQATYKNILLIENRGINIDTHVPIYPYTQIIHTRT